MQVDQHEMPMDFLQNDVHCTLKWARGVFHSYGIQLILNNP